MIDPVVARDRRADGTRGRRALVFQRLASITLFRGCNGMPEMYACPYCESEIEADLLIGRASLPCPACQKKVMVSVDDRQRLVLKKQGQPE
jgi:DNA-directed RNA polymerase subunit RPC12/RpoP